MTPLLCIGLSKTLKTCGYRGGALIRVYALRNSNNEYISNNVGEVTKDLLKAHLFHSEEIMLHMRYVISDYKLVSFRITEIYTDEDFI